MIIKHTFVSSLVIAVALAMPAAATVDCPEDINGDGEVSFIDLISLLGNWGTCPGCLEDINGDNVVDRADLTLLLAVWGPGCERPENGDVAHSIKIVDNTSGGAEPPFDPGTTHFTFDLQVAMQVEASLDDWTSTLAEAILTNPSASFYQHVPQAPFGGAPEPPDIIFFPAWEFDSYYCEPTVIPAGGTPGGLRSGAMNLSDVPYVEDPQRLLATWFNALPDQVPLTKYTIARYTIEVPEGFPRPCIFTGGTGGEMVIGSLDGNSTRQSFGDELLAFEFDIIATICPWDLNRDCVVGFSDLLAILSLWGPCDGCPEDITGDNVVGFSDLLEILSFWGLCP